MRATVTMNPTSYGTASLRHDIKTFLQFPTRDQCQVREEDDFDDRLRAVNCDESPSGKRVFNSKAVMTTGGAGKYWAASEVVSDDHGAADGDGVCRSGGGHRSPSCNR